MNDLDRAVLAFEHRYYRYGGRKLAAISAELGLTGTQYAQRLAWLAFDAEAMAADPVVTARLRRQIEDSRRRKRAA